MKTEKLLKINTSTTKGKIITCFLEKYKEIKDKDAILFEKQEEISKAAKISQGSVSNFFRKYEKTLFEIGEHKFILGKVEGGYKFITQKDISENAIHSLYENNVFIDTNVFEVSDSVVVLNVEKKNIEFLKTAFDDIFNTGFVFDFLPHKNKLYVILNQKTDFFAEQRRKLLKLPENVKRFSNKQKK